MSETVRIQNVSSFEDALEFTLHWEGSKYVNHPADKGGPTRWGITQRFARAKGYRGDMRSLPRDLAVKWYKESIWDRYGFGELYDIEVAGYLFDMAVNHGQWTRILQRAINEVGGSVTEDGVWGPETHEALLYATETYNLLPHLRIERCRYVVGLVERDRSQGVFLFGWLRRYLS